MQELRKKVQMLRIASRPVDQIESDEFYIPFSAE